MDKEKAVRLAFYFALKYHRHYGGGGAIIPEAKEIPEKVWNGYKFASLNSIAGDIFASVCQRAGIMGDEYFEMVRLFFNNSSA